MLQNVTSMIEFYLKQNMKVPSKESLDLELDPVLCRDEHGKRQFSKKGLPDWAKSFCEKIPLLLSQSLNVREGKLIHLVVIAQTNQEKEIPLVQVDFVPLDLHTFLSRLQSAISSRFEFQGSDGQRRYEVEVSAAPGCEDYKKFNWKELCKHVIWVYLNVLKVDEESPLINQITLAEDSVRQIVTESLPIASSSVDNISPSNDFRNRMERVKSILSKDKRKDQQLMWYLLHRERKPGENPHCKALRCKKEVLPGNLCVSVKGLEVRTNRHLLSSRISTSVHVHNWTVCSRFHRCPIWQFLTRFQSREMFLMPKLQVPCEMVFLCHLMIELNKSGLQSQKSGINKGTLRY